MTRGFDGDKSGNASLKPQPERFSIDVHPLQTLGSIRHCIAKHCKHEEDKVKLTGLTGRRNVRPAESAIGPTPWNPTNDAASRAHLAALPDNTLAADVGITEGSEIIALLSDKPVTNNPAADANATANATANTNGNGMAVNMIPGDAKEQPAPPQIQSSLDLTSLFSGSGGSSDPFFDTLISVLESLPPATAAAAEGSAGMQGVDGTQKGRADTHSLVWDLLLAMPTNSGTVASVFAAAEQSADPAKDGMAVDGDGERPSDWDSLLDAQHFERSVYVMQILDSILRPAPAIFSCLEPSTTQELSDRMSAMAAKFRTTFIESGGFEAVLKLFIESGKGASKTTKMGNEVALRIIKRCFFTTSDAGEALSEEGQHIIKSFANSSACAAFLRSLVAVAIEDTTASDNAILRLLQLTRMMLESGGTSITASFTSLPDNAAERFLTSLLLWKSSTTLPSGIVTASGIRSSKRIRTGTEEMILAVPAVSAAAIPWLIKSLEGIDPSTEGSDEFFSVLLKLVVASSANVTENAPRLRRLGMAVCVKLASYPRPDGDTAASNDEHSTGILCGCLKLLIALVNASGGEGEGLLVEGSQHILQSLSIPPWSDEYQVKMALIMAARSDLNANDKSMLDLMGSVFDGFLSGQPSICSDEDSRRLAYQVICAAAQTCHGGLGYAILSSKVNSIISNVAPTLRHRWGQNIRVDDAPTSRNANKSVKYSGLKNQGCTCYMNSVLQQLFMMPALREKICSAELPTLIRSSGGAAAATGKGGESLIGKKICVHWENGNKYDAIVAAYNEKTGMHRINYCMVHLADRVGHHHHQQQQAPDVGSLPRDLQEEYILSEGRPGKETGAFEIVAESPAEEGKETTSQELSSSSIKETPDEASSRLLLEEVQRTFVNLSAATRSRNCYDPRSLVEASHCLKLEFDVWQQNDASEFATKLLDRLEISLKKWSPVHFRYLGHTFGMKKVVQKICRECGLKSNREEDLMNIDCQIRNISSIDEALSSMCEDEVMEGDNKVSCDRCKVKTNTVLRTAISALPDMLVLSLKRFDLDYTTFETVKLNNRCEFGESLNMKQYTLQAKEILEAAEASAASNARSGGEAEESKSETGSLQDSLMDLEESETKDRTTPGQGNDEDEFDPLSVLPDEDYEYRLAGVLVHAGVAQGGHYYSFIKERGASSAQSTIPKSTSHNTILGASSHATSLPRGDKWYRFDDEDVTPFDPSSIEQECFGGTVKKETKYPNGHIDSRSHDRIANALMLFYEKVKPLEFDDSKEEDEPTPADAKAGTDGTDAGAPMEEDTKDEENAVPSNLPKSNGYDVFLPEVKKSNSTHNLQSFLLKEEFRAFVKELLDICNGGKKSKQDDEDAPGDSMDITPASSPTPADPRTTDGSSPLWRIDIIRTALSFLFDILFHLPLEQRPLDEWSKTLAEIFFSSPDVTAMFVSDLATRTRSVRDNWVRAYTMECPEEGSRRTAVQIFVSAITSLLRRPSEQALLRNWTACWSAQVAEHEELIRQRKPIGAMPTRLEAPNARSLEDVDNVGRTASSVGILLSFVSELIEVSLRYTQGNIDLCLLVRELARVGADNGDSGSQPPYSTEGKLLRDAMVTAQFIPRLTCLVTREHTNNFLRHFFPGSSASMEVIEAISRNESHPTTNIMQMGMNNNAGDRNIQQNPTHLIEAIGCLLGVPWVVQEPTSYETGEVNRGRAIRALTPRAIKALTEVFEETKPDGAAGMTSRGVGQYLQKCGQHVNPQRIEEIFRRHSVEEEIDGSKRHVLNLTGFLAYYRESVHTNEYQVQQELQTAFGFRPNLTRRPEEARFYALDDEDNNSRRRHFRTIEGIATDVAINRDNLSRTNTLADLGLQNLHFVNFARTTDRFVCEYVLAASTIGRDTSRLMTECIDFLHQNIQHLQHNNEGCDLIITVMQVLTAIPDEKLVERISMLMLKEDNDLYRTGLVVHGDMLIRDHPSYDIQSRLASYLQLIKQLRKQRDVNIWFSRNRSPRTAWTEPEERQSRSDHHSGRHGHRQQMHAQVQDQMDGMEDSDLDEDDDDEYSRSSADVSEMVVEGSGTPEVNGIYRRSGIFDNVPKFSKTARYHGKDEEFSLFRCKLTDNTRRWYISIVPLGSHPGTTKDIDFYAVVPNSRDMSELPPRDNWMAIPQTTAGLPAPTVYPRDVRYGEGGGDEYDDDHGRPRANVVLEDGYL